MKENRITFELENVVLEREGEEPITIKKGKMSIILPESFNNDLVNVLSANETQTVKKINYQGVKYAVPTGFDIVSNDKDNAIIAYNEYFGYLTYIPTVNGEGVWTNTYEISMDEKTNFLVSKPGLIPWTNVKVEQANALIKRSLNGRILGKDFCARICLDQEYDAILRVINELTKIPEELFHRDSSKLGVYLLSNVMIKTGKSDKYTIYGINNFCGNTCTLTYWHDKDVGGLPIARGGHYGDSGEYSAAFSRTLYPRLCLKEFTRLKDEHREKTCNGRVYYGDVYYYYACPRLVVQTTKQDIIF